MSNEYERFVAEAIKRFREKTHSGGVVGSVAAVSIDRSDAQSAHVVRPPLEPVGDVFYDLVSKLGYYVPCAACAATRGKMNALGVAGCRERFDELVAEVKRNVENLQRAGMLQRTLWTDTRAALAALKHGIQVDLDDPIAGVLRTAIERAERAAKTEQAQ